MLGSSIRPILVFFSVAVCLSFYDRPIDAYKILGLFAISAKSHYIVFDALMVELANRGHLVTVYSPFPKDRPIANYTDVDIRKCVPAIQDFNRFEDMLLRSGSLSAVEFILNLHPTYEDLANCDPLMELFSSGSTAGYDLAITEMFNTDVLLMFPYKFNIPFIGVMPNAMFPWLTRRMGNPDNPSYMAQLQEEFVTPETFCQRVRNTFVYLSSLTMYDYMSARKTDLIFGKFFGASAPTITELVKNTSLLFINTHVSLNPVIPLVPAVVPIGGLYVKSAKPLPMDIEKFINESEHGVVYFCMGSLLRGSSFPEDKRDAFLYAFSKIPQRVLWKWEGDVLPGKSNNIMTAKWMPQRDILAHPKVKLFISHGGLLGTNEAVYEGVPILGIPIFGDQRTNVKSIEASGAGDMLDYNEISKEVVLEKIQRLLNDPKYRENAKELSRRYRDRPMSPLDTAVYWTEYVIRHKGAHHLRSAAVDMPWYQYLLLDVIAFVLFVLITFLVIVYYSLKLTLRFVLNKFLRKQAGVGTDNKKVKSN